MDVKHFRITKSYTNYNLGIKVGTKRKPVIDNNNVWVDTNPLYVFDLRGLNVLGSLLIQSLLPHIQQLLLSQSKGEP